MILTRNTYGRLFAHFHTLPYLPVCNEFLLEYPEGLQYTVFVGKCLIHHALQIEQVNTTKYSVSYK